MPTLNDTQYKVTQTISVPYATDRFYLPSSRVEAGWLVFAADTKVLYVIKDVENLNNSSGYTDLSTGGSGSGDLLAANNLSDLDNAATARTNLGVAIGTDVQAYDADLTTWAGKTAPSGAVVGTTDTQTLTNKTVTAPVLGGTVTGTYTLGGTPTFPATVVATTGAQTLTDKTLTAPVLGGTVTGTYTLGGTPTFPSSVVTLTGTQTLTNKTLDAPTLTGTTTAADINSSGTLTATTGTVAGEPIGYRGVPINSQSAAYTLVLTDAGKCILHPSSDDNARTFTIPANASVAFPVNTVVQFVNMQNTVTIAITSDTLSLLDGSGTIGTGSRTLAEGGVAVAQKISSTAWVISGKGLT